MRLTTALIVSALLLAIAPLAASAQQIDLSTLFLLDAPRPTITSVPIPAGSAFIAVDTTTFDRTDPRLVATARIGRFPLGSDRNVSLTLRRLEVISPTGITVAGTAAGDVPFELDKHLIFSGAVEGVQGSYVYLAIFRTFCIGYVEIPTPEGVAQRYIIAPERTNGIGSATAVVYDSHLLPPPERPHTECSAENLPGYQERVDEIFRGAMMFSNRKNEGERSHPLATTTYSAQVAVECDLRYFTAHSSSLSHAANYAIIVLGASSAIYQRDINVTLQVPYLRIWTTTGPYKGDSTANDLLNDVRTYWSQNMGSVERTTTALLSHATGGGVAWVGVMCNKDYGYAAIGLNNDVNFPADNYLWDVDVTSHELGHNFGSAHTHNCSWAPPIDSCYLPEGGCTTETNPRTGTIMSYCHLSVGTQLYFHPRVATLIRENFSQSDCVHPVEGVLANDLAVAQIVTPALGGSIVKGASFAPSVIVRNIGTAAQTNIPVIFTITSSSTGARTYADTMTIGSLAAGASTTLSFEPLSIADVGRYEARGAAILSTDQGPINNTMERPFETIDEADPATITVTAPNGGEVYAAGSTVTVLWSASGTSTVTIQFSPDDGITWTPIRFNRAASPGTLSWTVPAVPTTHGRVRINSLYDAAITDMSDAPFTITVGKDIQALDFIDPVANSSTTSPITPKVAFRNNGTQTLNNVPVRLRMLWRGDGQEDYNQSATIGEIAPGAVTTIEFPATRLLPSGTHVMIARALLTGDEAPSNDSIGRTCEVGGIAPPSKVTAYPMSRAVLLTWTPSSNQGVTGYQIFRGTSRDSLTLIATTHSTVLAHADEPLNDGTHYFYAVTTVTGAQSSIYSQIIPATPTTYPAGFTMAAPELLVPEPEAANLPLPSSFLWRSVAGAEIYQLQIATDAAMTDVRYVQFTNTPLVTLQNDFGTTYHWRVRAFNYSTTSPWSPVSRFSTGANCSYALNLDGTGATLMHAPEFTWSDTAVTVEFWNYVRSSDVKEASLFNLVTSGDPIRFQAHAPWSDRVLYWDYGNISGNGRISTDYAKYLDTWTHVALVSNGKNFKGIYLNGVLAAFDTKADFPNGAKGLTLGSFGNGFQKGMIDELRIWKRVRTKDEIARTMYTRIDPQDGLVGYWRFDEGSGTTTADLSSNGTIDTLTAGTFWVTSTAPINCEIASVLEAPVPIAPVNGDRFTIPFTPALSWSEVPRATAYELQLATSADFVSDARTIPDVTEPFRTVEGLRPSARYYWHVRARNGQGTSQWSATTSFTTAAACSTNALLFNGKGAIVSVDSFDFKGRGVTVEFWNYVDTTQLQNAAAFCVGTGSNQSNRLQSNAPWSDRTLYWDYGNTSSMGRITIDYTPYLNRWTHVALVSNGIDFKAIYLNGALAASSSLSSVASNLTGLTIGGVPGSVYHAGMMDEFRIWNTPRTQDAIRSDMYHRLLPPRSGLLGYWRLDEGTGQTANDSSRFGHNGTLVSAPAWRSVTLPLGAASEPINGPEICVVGSSGNVYSVTARPGDHYTWNVLGGTIVAGEGGASITVQWLGGTPGVVALRTDRESDCPDSVEMRVKLTAKEGVGTEDAGDGFSFASAPDPFSASTVLSYRLAHREHISLKIYSVDGALVALLADGIEDAGDHTVTFNGAGLPSGVYICRFGVGDRALQVRTLHLVR